MVSVRSAVGEPWRISEFVGYHVVEFVENPPLGLGVEYLHSRCSPFGEFFAAFYCLTTNQEISIRVLRVSDSPLVCNVVIR